MKTVLPTAWIAWRVVNSFDPLPGRWWMAYVRHHGKDIAQILAKDGWAIKRAVKAYNAGALTPADFAHKWGETPVCLFRG